MNQPHILADMNEKLTGINKPKEKLDHIENIFESYEDYTECPHRIIIKEIQLDYLQPDAIKEKCISPWKCFNKECPANNPNG